MNKEYSRKAQSVIEDVNGFVRGEERETKTGTSSNLRPYESLIAIYPFTSGKLRAKLANRFVAFPLLVIRRAFKGYFAQTDYVAAQILDQLDAVQEGIEPFGTSYLQQLFEQKIYEIAKLNDRLKSELMAEINKDQSPIGMPEKIATKIINEAKHHALRKLNLGSGSFLKEGYINIDHREIEGVDVIADIAELPYEAESIEEIFLSHVAEHFTELKIRSLLRYWYGLLKANGKIVIIVPDIEAMVRQYANREITWDNLRQVILGGQDYNSDYHFNVFSADYMGTIIRDTLPEAGYKLVTAGRRNGECLEMEVAITKPRA